MPGTARASKHRIALGKQVEEGLPQVEPGFEIAVSDASIEPTQAEQAYEVTDIDDLPLDWYKSSASGGGSITTITDVDAAGLLWFLHLGADAVTGTSPNLTHTIVRSYAKPLATVFQHRPHPAGGDRWERVTDAFLSSIELKATKGQPIETTCDFIGKRFTFHTNPILDSTNDRRIGKSATKLLSMIEAELKLNLSSSPADTRVRNIESLVLRSEYDGAEWIQTDELTPRYLDLGHHRVGFSGEGVFEDFTEYAATFFGDDNIVSNMDLSPVVVKGSFDFLFNIVPIPSANRTLRIVCPNVRVTVAPTKVDPGGGAVRYSYTAEMAKPSGEDEAITVTVKNSIESY